MFRFLLYGLFATTTREIADTGVQWIAVEEIVGTIRLRLQIVSDAPFVRNVTFTLMGVPHVEASAIPMTKLLPNVLDLPLVSSFVQSSIAAASSIYVAPK